EGLNNALLISNPDEFNPVGNVKGDLGDNFASTDLAVLPNGQIYAVGTNGAGNNTLVVGTRDGVTGAVLGAADDVMLTTGGDFIQNVFGVDSGRNGELYFVGTPDNSGLGGPQTLYVLDPTADAQADTEFVINDNGNL